MKKIFTLFILIICSYPLIAQTRIVSAASGNWNAAATWVGGIAPGINDIAEIASGHTVIINLGSPKTEVARMEISGTVNFSTTAYPLEIYGDLIINASGVFNAYRAATNYSKLVTIHGNLANNGAFNAPYAIESSSSTADKNGGIIMGSASAGTTISGSGIFSVIRRLTIDNANGVTLAVPVRVSDILTLKNGIFYNSANLTIDNTTVGTAPAGAATSSANCRLLRSQSSSLNAPFTLPATAGYFAGYVQNTAGANSNQAFTEGYEIPRRTIAGIVMSHPPGVTFLDDLTLTSAAPPLTLTSGIITVTTGKTIICSNATYPGITGASNSYVDGGLALTKSTTEGPLTFPVGSDGANRRVLVTGIKAKTGNVTVRFSIEKPGGGTNTDNSYDLSQRRWYGTVMSGILDSFTSIGITYNPDDNASSSSQLARSQTAAGVYTNMGVGPSTSSVVYSPYFVAPPPTPVVTTPNFTDTDWKGLVWVPYSDYWGGSGVKTDAADIANAGFNWVRVFFRSDSSITTLDSLVSNCNLAKVKIIAAYKKMEPRNDLGTAAQQAADTARLRSLVHRYKNNIHFWEIHNEPNLDGTYWNLGGNSGIGSTDPSTPYNQGVNRYVQWLRLAYNTIKSEDSTATVVLGGLSSYLTDAFMDRLTAEQAYNYFDEVAFHPYADDPTKVIGRLNAFKNKIAAWPAPKNDLPIWLTEIGFHTGTTSGGSAGVADEETKAKYLKDMYTKMIQNLKYKRPVFWYSLHEQQPGSNYFNLTSRNSINAGPSTYFAAYDTIKNMNNTWSYYQGQGAEIVQEFEYLNVAATSGDAVSVFYEVGFSNSNCSVYQSNGIDDSVSYTIPNILPGTYHIKLGSKRTSTRGIFQTYLYPQGNFAGGQNVGTPQDLYGASSSYEELDLGMVTITTGGDQIIQFKVTGKNAASSGYNMVFDYIRLVP